MKKSNFLLLVFYLTLLLCFIGYLVGAKNYIDNHYADGGLEQGVMEFQRTTITNPVHHLVVLGNHHLQNLSVGPKTEMKSYNYGEISHLGGYFLHDDTLYIIGDFPVVEIQLEQKLNSIHLAGSSLDFDIGILEENAQVYFSDGVDGAQNTLDMNNGEFSSLNIFIENSELRLTESDNSKDAKIGNLRITMMNANFEIEERTNFEIGGIEIHSYNADNRISVPSEFMERIRHFKHYSEDYSPK